MKVLALDLSSPRGSVAVAERGVVTQTRHFACERGRGAGVFGALAELREAWRGADIIAVGVGPGSYNGLRAACAVAGSMQMATGAELRACPSPCLLGVHDGHYFVYGDARGGRAYRAEVMKHSLRDDVALLDYADAAETVAKDTPSYRCGPLACLDFLPEAHPDAAVLALLAPELPPLAPADLRPIYLKPPHITLPRTERT